MSIPSPEVGSLIASFNEEASTYDVRLGIATRSVSIEIIDLIFPSLRQPFAKSKHVHSRSRELRENVKVLDSGCGTGAFTLGLADLCLELGSHAVQSVWATDIAPNMVHFTSKAAQKRQLLDSSPLPADSVLVEDGIQGSAPAVQSEADRPIPRIHTAECDGQHFTQLFPTDGYFDLIVSNFGLFFYPSPAKGAAEMYRLLSDSNNAAVVVTCWENMGTWPLFLEIQARIAPKQTVSTLKIVDLWKDGTRLENTLRDAGFAQVELEKRKVVQWARGIVALSKGIAELFRGLVANTWTEQEMEIRRLVKLVEEALREKKDKYLIDLDEDGDGDKDGRIGFELVAWIAIARKT